MNNRQMYNYAKEHGCIYSNEEIKRRIRLFGNVKRFRIYESDQEHLNDNWPAYLFFDRVNRIYYNINFEKMVRNGDRLMTEAEYDAEFAIPLQAIPTVQEVEYFTAEELQRIETINNEMNINHFYSYGGGDPIYERLGVFKDGRNDCSPTIGFEIETNLDLGCAADQNLIAREYLDKRLGHIESDSSISGVEFNSHIFTWNKLKKIRPLFDKQLLDFANAGLAASTGAGLHIHIGRRAFTSEKAFQKFYYIINKASNRRFWTAVARRDETRFCSYPSIPDEDLAALQRSVSSRRQEHGISVNQQHSATYEIRIFQSTLSTDVLYGCIEILLNLVNLCNNEQIDRISSSQLKEGEYAAKYSRLFYSPDFTTDLSFMAPLSRERLVELVNEALTNGDTSLGMRYLQQIQQLERGNG